MTTMMTIMIINIIPMMILFYILMNNVLNIKMNPLKLIITLILYSIMLSISTYLYTLNSINNLMILIVFISGMMITFIYFSSMINSPMKKNWSGILWGILLTAFLIIIFLFKKTKNFDNPIKIGLNLDKNTISNIFQFPNHVMLLLMIMTLILTLFLIFKMCYINKKSLRSKM